MESELLTITETTQIVKVLESQNLPQTRADQIEAIFTPMVAKLREFDEPFAVIVAEPITKELIAKAKRLRLDIAKVRIAAEHQRKEAKEQSLREGKAIDGVCNILKLATQEKEDALEKIEKHFETLESQRIAGLQIERAASLVEYEVDPIPGNLGSMDDAVWANYLAGTKLNYDARKEAERKAEEERIAREQAEAEERERIRQENERLRAEAEEREKIEAVSRAKAAAEKAKLEAKLKKEREEAAARLEAERKERERIESELRAREEAEAAAKAEEAARAKREREEMEAREREAAAAPDNEKLFKLAASIGAIELPHVQSVDAQAVINSISSRIDELVSFIEDSAAKLGQSKAA